VRQAFVSAVTELAANDERVVLLTGDLGFMVVEQFAERFPDRFYNVGVAEQNMVGMATGLAEAGFVPFVYSIATFASMRPYEFIRNGPLLHELPVRIAGIGGGFDYGHNGVTHFALEDVALMRVQPDMTVIVPADDDQARAAVFATAAAVGPVYFRIAKDADLIPGLRGDFELGRANILTKGEDMALIALGPMVAEALDAAVLLAEDGINASVIVVSSFNPSPTDDIAAVLARVPVAVTAEAHYRVGALGSFVAEVIAAEVPTCRLVRCAVPEMPRGVTGSRTFLLERFGLTARALARSAIEALQLQP
jgi:transketolase